MRQEIYDSKKPRIEDCKTGRVYVRINETEINVTENVQTGVDTFEPHEVTKYRYDKEIVEVRSFSEDNVLSALKEKKIAEIRSYDSSSNVNQFAYSGMTLWLDKETRGGLLVRFNAEKSAGKTETTLWAGDVALSLNIDTAIQILYAIEVYASACYDNTASHIATVNAMQDIESVMGYDFKSGYPNKLIFTL